MKLNFYIILFLIIVAVSDLNAQVSASSFIQDVKTEILLPP